MPASWLERMRRWFRQEPSATGSFDPAAFERLCLEDPEAAIDALRRDQRELAEDLERTYAAYRSNIEEHAAKLAALSAEDAHTEARALMEAQDAIRRTLRRIAASSLVARDLEQELHEWESRSGEEGARHADHPDVRAEIIRSELATRGRVREMRAIAFGDSPFRTAMMSESEIGEDADDAGLDNIDLPETENEHLIEAIRQASREAERWHGHHAPDEDAVAQVHHMKELHAILKRLDRERGLRRERVIFAPRMRPIDS